MPRLSVVANVSCLVIATWLAPTAPSAAQGSVALAGKVTAAQEALEGVLVSARKSDSSITVTVVSGKDGSYSFPAGRLEPGQYSLRIRATGYDLDGPDQVLVAPDKTATADLALRKSEDIASQLTNAEWLASMPGTDAQKGHLLNCVGCHTLDRPLRSKYSADDFLTMVLPRMQGYVNQSIPAHPQLRRAERLMEERGDQRVQIYRGAAEYLASVNLSLRPTWNFDFKTLPRPTGAATRVIYTEWIFFALMGFGLMRARRRPDYRPAYRAWGSFMVPLIFIAASLGVVFYQVAADLKKTSVGLLLVMLGLPLYYLWVRKSAASSQ